MKLTIGQTVRLTKDLRHRCVRKGAVGTVTEFGTLEGQQTVTVRFPYQCPFPVPAGQEHVFNKWDALFVLSSKLPFVVVE